MEVLLNNSMDWRYRKHHTPELQFENMVYDMILVWILLHLSPCLGIGKRNNTSEVSDS